MDSLRTYNQTKVFRFGIILFWALYWLFNVLDLVIGPPRFLWAGKDRFEQFVKNFNAIGITSPGVISGSLVFTTILELIATIFLIAALRVFVRGNEEKAHSRFFWGTVAGLAVFIFFGMGDQVFGNRLELLEHMTYVFAIIVSWAVYVYLPRLNSPPANK